MDSSGGHVRQQALKPRLGDAGLPAPVTAYKKQAMRGKQGMSGRGANLAPGTRMNLQREQASA